MIKISNEMAIYFIASFNHICKQDVHNLKSKLQLSSQEKIYFILWLEKDTLMGLKWQRLAVPQRPKCWTPLRSWSKAPSRWWTHECVPSGFRVPAACETPVLASDTEKFPAAAAVRTGRLSGSPLPPVNIWSPAHPDSWPLRSAWARSRTSSSLSPAAWWRPRRTRPSVVGSGVLN